MNQKITTAALLVGALLFTGTVFADCPGPFVRDMKRAYENAKAAESQGKTEDALFFYHGAQGSVCENSNPYEADAAKRAAPLGLELGTAAEKRGDLDKARQLYEAGGQFAAADRVFMQAIRTKADEPGSYQSALEHFNNRRETWWAQNNSAALKVTGAYAPDAKLIAEADAMPAKAIERLTQKEAKSFNEEFLRDFVQVAQASPDDGTDANQIQRAISASQAFTQKWKNGDDYRKVSRDALQTLRMWGFTVRDPKMAAAIATNVAQLSEQRATTLRQKYFGAPELLEDAMAYYRVPGSDNAKAETQVASVKAQALKLGDEANGKKRTTLAVAYYRVADADDKAKAVEERAQQAAMQKMQPSIDQMRKQADAMAKEFSDPAKVAQMQKQAQATRKAMQEQQAGARSSNKKAAADLEKELGL